MVLGDLLSPLHIALLLIVALLIFGPRRLPELGGAVGKTIKEFQRSMSEARSSLTQMTSLESSKTDTSSAETDKPN